MNFDQAFDKLLGHEGGYLSAEAAARQGDPGGETKFGISKRSYPHLDIAGLTVADARAIYLRDYWTPAACDAVPEALKFQVFDVAVNSGVKTAIKLLQRTVCVTADGVIGPQTMTALKAMPASRFIAHFNSHRLALMAGLTNWPAHGRGWALRVAENLLEA